MSFEADTEELGEIRVVSLAGEVDDRTAQDFQTLLLESSSGSESGLLLDAAALEWINGLSLRALVTLNRRLKAEGRRLAVCSLGKRIENALEIARLKHLLPVFASRNEAQNWLARTARIDSVCRLAGTLLQKEQSSERKPTRRRYDFETQRLATVAAELLDAGPDEGEKPSND